MASRFKSRRRVYSLDPVVYENDRPGFIRALEAIHRAAELGCDTRGAYLIVENDRVVGIGGCSSLDPNMPLPTLPATPRTASPARRLHPAFRRA